MSGGSIGSWPSRVGLAAVAAALAVSVAACGSSSEGGAAHPAASRSASVTLSVDGDGNSLEQWRTAYAYLGAQTRPTEIVCSWLSGQGPHQSAVPRPALFYAFADRSAWSSHLLTRFDKAPRGTYEECGATVPTSVSYGPDIETFLGRYGLVFGSGGAGGLVPVEIMYAGQNASDPDIIYCDKPGLFALSVALRQLGAAPFEPGTSVIIQPTDDATAARYLGYARPLLDWYGYQS